MDVRDILDRAMRRANLSPRQLAARAGTSTSALSAYRRGVRSPTVRTLERLLQVCELQLRVQLEPFLADLDAVVDALLAPPTPLGSGAEAFGTFLTEAGVSWAFDGCTALRLQGLAADDFATEVVLADSMPMRHLMNNLCIEPVTKDDQMLWNGWLGADLTNVGGLTFSRFGPVKVRVLPELPTPLLVQVGDATYPVTCLLDVEQRHPQLADVLARLRERRTVLA